MIWHGYQENAGIFENVCQNFVYGRFVLWFHSWTSEEKKSLLRLWFSYCHSELVKPEL